MIYNDKDLDAMAEMIVDNVVYSLKRDLSDALAEIVTLRSLLSEWMTAGDSKWYAGSDLYEKTERATKVSQ